MIKQEPLRSAKQTPVVPELVYPTPETPEDQDKPLCDDPIINNIDEALQASGWEYFFPRPKPKVPGSSVGFWDAWAVGIEDIQSCTGAVLPSYFGGPGSEYDDYLGDVTVAYNIPMPYNNATAVCNIRGMLPFAMSIGSKSIKLDNGSNVTVGALYLTNVVYTPFIGANTAAAVAAMFVGVNIAHPFPDDCGIMLAGILNADGTITWIPIEATFINDYQSMAITFPQYILQEVSGCGSNINIVAYSRYSG